MSLRALVALLWIVICVPSTADAQRRRGRAGAESDAAQAASREQFQRGLDAASAERWEEALDAFSQAYDLAPTPTTLLNIAGAQAQLGRVHEAVESYESYLATRPVSEIARYRRQAEEALASTRLRFARARIRLRGLQPGDRVELDALPLAPRDLDAEQLLDPRSHTIVVFRGTSEVFRREFTLREGAEENLEFEVVSSAWAGGPRTTVGGPPIFEDEPDSPRSGVTKSPWFWVGVGAGAAAIATVIVVAIVATQDSGPSGPEPYVGNGSPGLIRF